MAEAPKPVRNILGVIVDPFLAGSDGYLFSYRNSNSTDFDTYTNKITFFKGSEQLELFWSEVREIKLADASSVMNNQGGDIAFTTDEGVVTVSIYSSTDKVPDVLALTKYLRRLALFR